MSDNPQSPDSTYLLSHQLSNSPRLSNKHPLTKQYPLSPPISSSFTTCSPPRVPPILSPDGSHETISLRTPPQEDCGDVLMESQDDTKHQLIIKKEENMEYIEKDDKNVNNNDNVKTDLQDTVGSDILEESISCKLKHDDLSPSPTVQEEEEMELSSSQSEETKMETNNVEQEQLDAAYSLSLIQVTEVASSSSSLLSSITACLPICCSTMLSSASTESCPHPLSPPTAQSENSSIISGSSTESDHELSLIMLGGDAKHSSSSVSSDAAQHDQVSPRKRNLEHDSGLDNGSEESDCPETKRMATDTLDFSIDMSEL